jgi:LmbE family N-acetylglucosaminyl deacetylase
VAKSRSEQAFDAAVAALLAAKREASKRLGYLLTTDGKSGATWEEEQRIDRLTAALSELGYC